MVVKSVVVAGLMGLCSVMSQAVLALDENDSVRSWGRWEHMLAPAAGPALQVTPAVLVGDQAGLDLRPEEGSALARQVVVPEPAPVQPPVVETPPVVPGPPIVIKLPPNPVVTPGSPSQGFFGGGQS